MTRLVLLLGFAAAMGNALELTPATWDEHTNGKTVFIKFLAPWCGHCKKLKPDWDKLMDAFKGSATALVADVDCTTEGKELCETHGVRGYPSIKYGDPSDLQDYQGGRSYDALKKFAEENLKPVCSPANIDLCDADKKAEIEKLQAMSKDDLDTKVKDGEKKQKDIEQTFKDDVQGLQERYKKMNEKKDADLKAIKESGLGLAKAVLAQKKKDEL